MISDRHLYFPHLQPCLGTLPGNRTRTARVVLMTSTIVLTSLIGATAATSYRQHVHIIGRTLTLTHRLSAVAQKACCADNPEPYKNLSKIMKMPQHLIVFGV